MVHREMPNCAVIYDEQLSFETALEQLRTSSNFKSSDSNQLPLFAYNRTVLLETELGLGKRAKNEYGNIRVNNQNLSYSSAYGEFEIQFMYISNSVEDTEKFEIVYNSNEGITGSKELIVDMPLLGQFKYFLEFQELGEKMIERDEVYYKAIIGSIRLRGFYFTFRGASKVIEQINQKIYASSNVTLKLKDEKISDNIIS